MSTVTERRVDRGRRAAGRRRARGRGLTLGGVLLVLVGLGLGGYLGWQLYGTTWVAHRHQHQIVQALREQWRSADVRSDAGSPGGSRGGSDGEVVTAAGPARAIVHIPRFGADYEVPVVEGTDDRALAAGIGHFAGTAGPGAVGNYALAAHRITHGEPFSRLPELRKGDHVVVETRAATYTYEVDNAGDSLDLSFTDTWVVGPRPVNPTGGIGPVSTSDRLLTLTTCAELFHTDRRLVVFGHLIDTAATPRSHVK